MAKWIEELKPGDKVLNGDELIEVTAIHKLHVVCGNYKYQKTSGRLAGSSGYYSSHIREATLGAIVEINDRRIRSRLLTRVVKNNFNRNSTTILQQIVDLLDSDKGGE